MIRFVNVQWNKRWKFQLLSVACFSLAVKMEEPEVPLLLDLQVSEPRFVFEPKSIQRMELWVMKKLNWRLRSITPFDFLHYFIFKLPHSSSFNHHCFLWKCSDLVLKTIRGMFVPTPPQIQSPRPFDSLLCQTAVSGVL